MAIKDVSKQWAALLESEMAADKEYAEACEESCDAIEKANEDEIENFDEEEIDPADCGFTEDEMQVDEVVDPLQMWKDMKKQEAPKKNVKVDAKYIDTMKKLLSKIKVSKAQLYNTVMAKLDAYKAAGTELPPPEDYAENFVPFEMIQKVIGGKEDSSEEHIEGDDDDEKMIAGREYATDRSAAELGDTNNPFGNADAEANMYDSEITEDEAEEAKKKVDDIIKKELKEKGSAEDMKKWLDDNKDKLDEVIGKIKNEKVKKQLKGYVKLLGKYCNGEVTESELDEAKKASDGHVLPIMKGIWKILKIVLGCGLIGVAGIGFCISKIAGAVDGIGKKLGNKLMESLAMEVCDEDEAKEKEDAEELAEDGCSVKEKEEVNEADDREPASHLLDAVGVKASTASLKAQDTAMISVVEMLLKKIDKLEARLDEACKPKRKAKKLSEGEEDLPDGPEEWDFDEEGMTAEDRKNYEEAVKIQDISYRRELTKSEEDKFRKLLDKLPDIAKDHLLSNTMGPNGFARPGDIPLVNDPTVHPDDGGGNGSGGFGKAKIDFDQKVPIPPFNYKQGSHRPSSAEERKAAKEKFDKEQEQKRLAGRFPARGKKDADGKKGIWSGNEWKAMVNSLTPSEKKNLLNSIIEEIRAEGKANGTDPRQIASEVAFTKEHFGDKLDSRDFAQMLYGVTDFDDIEKKRVGIDKYAREGVIDIITNAFKDEEDPKAVAKLIRANLNAYNVRSKIAKTPLIHGDDPTDIHGEDPLGIGKGLPKGKENKLMKKEAEEVEEADDVISAEEFFSEAEKEDSDKEDKETK